MSMCLWVRAMDTYATVYRIVEPKRQVLATAQAALDASNAVLAEKQAQLKSIREKVAALQQQLADTQRELASLQFQVRSGVASALRASHYVLHWVAPIEPRLCWGCGTVSCLHPRVPFESNCSAAS
jgi:Tfp pilus assembly protein PilO